MRQPRLAARYAKSLIDLAKEQNQLDTAFKDIQLLNSLIAGSPDLTSLLRSPIIKADKKNAILSAILGDKVSPFTQAFIQLMVRKGREAVLPEVGSSFVEMYNTLNDIHVVKFVTATPVNEALLNDIKQIVKEQTGFKHIEMQPVVNEDIIGGFVLEFDNKLVDASILYDLNAIRKQFKSNVYVRSIR